MEIYPSEVEVSSEKVVINLIVLEYLNPVAYTLHTVVNKNLYSFEWSTSSANDRKEHALVSARSRLDSGVVGLEGAIDVVEHLYDVPSFVGTCIEKLDENSRLVVMTGNIDCLSARLSGRGWWYAQFPEHIVFPSKKYFSDYLGLKIEKWISSYAANSFEYLKYMGFRTVLGAMLGMHTLVYPR